MCSVKPVLWASDRNVLIHYFPMPLVGARHNFPLQPYSNINRAHILQIIVIPDMFCNSNFYFTVMFSFPFIIVKRSVLFILVCFLLNTLCNKNVYMPNFYLRRLDSLMTTSLQQSISGAFIMFLVKLDRANVISINTINIKLEFQQHWLRLHLQAQSLI